MENRYKITLDFKQRSNTNINFIQNDIDTSALEFTIADGGQVVDITGQTVSIAFLKSDNTIVIQNSTSGVTILDGPNGKLECILRSNTLAYVGIVRAEISFSLDGKKLSTAQFVFNVSSSIDNGQGILSTNEIPLLDAKITEASEKISDLATALASAVTATDAANKAATDAINTDESIQTAEDLRVTAEIGRADAEIIRQENEDLRQGTYAQVVDAVAMESARQTAEIARQAQAVLSQTQEDIRETNEGVRQTQEANRQATYQNFNGAVQTTQLDWGTPVTNFADLATTYPMASVGKCVQVLSEGKWYRYNGTAWEYKGSFSLTGMESIANVLSNAAYQAAFRQKQMHSGCLNFPVITSGGTTTPNSIIIPAADYNINGNILSMPQTTVVLPDPPTTGTRDDLVFLETYFPVTNPYQMVGRYRTVAGVNFSVFNDNGFCTIGSINADGQYDQLVTPQGGNTSPLTYAFSTKNMFMNNLKRVVIGGGAQIASEDVGLYTSGAGDATSKSTLLTYDGYSYAIPIARVKRRNSGGFSPSNPNGAYSYIEEALAMGTGVVSVENMSYQLTVSSNFYNLINIGDKLIHKPSGLAILQVASKDGSNKFTAIAKISGYGSATYFIKSDRPDNTYVNIIDARDIPQPYDLRHIVTPQNYEYLLKKSADQFQRGEIGTQKKMLTVHHGIPKSEIDEHTVFYASLDGTLIPTIGSATGTVGTVFKPSPTGTGTVVTGNMSMPTVPMTNGSTMDFWYLPTDSSEHTVINAVGNQINPLAKQGDFKIYDNKWHHCRVSVKSNGDILIYTDGNLKRTYSAYFTSFDHFSISSAATGIVSDLHISNIDRGSLFPNLPPDFISGDAVIMPKPTEQRKLYSQAQMTQLTTGIAKGSNSGNSRGITATQATSGVWVSGDTIKVTGMAGELISGVFDADTALATIIKDQNTGDTSLTVDTIAGLVVNDTFQILDQQLGTLRTTIHTVSAIAGTVLTITPALTAPVSKYQSLIMETTASSSYPTINFLNGTTKTPVAGTWTALGTNVAVFTLGTNVTLTNQDIQLDYSTIMPSGQPALTAPTTATLAGEAGIRIPSTSVTLLTNDFTGKISGRTWENPNIAKTGSVIVANNPAPSTFTTELLDSEYVNILTQNGTSFSYSTSVNGQQAAVLLSFDLIKIIERKLGSKIPGKNTVGKIAWIKANVASVTSNVWCNGSSPTGNKATVKVWSPTVFWTDGGLSSLSSNTSISPSKLYDSVAGTSSTIDASTGISSILCFADPSDGVTPSTINVDYASLDITFASKVLNSYKLVNGALAVRDDFAGKTAGDVTGNPNVASRTLSTYTSNTLMLPTTVTNVTEIDSTRYTSLGSLDSNLFNVVNTNNGSSAQLKISWNLIRIFEDKYGPIPAIDKVQWLKDNLTSVSCSWWGYGSGPNTSQTHFAIWNGSNWFIVFNGSISSVTKQTTNSTPTSSVPISQVIDANGMIYLLAYADPSDGVTPSTIYTDYCNIELTLKPAPTGYDTLVPDNPRRDAGPSQILYVRKETKEVQVAFGRDTDLNLVTYSDYLPAPDPIAANTDVTILAEIPEFLVTDLGSAVGMKQGTHHWMNPAYRVGQDNDALYGEIGFSSVPFAPDSVGVNIGAKVTINGTGFIGNYTLQRSLNLISKPVVSVGRWLVVYNGELKLLVKSSYVTTGLFSNYGDGIVYLLSIFGKPLSKEIDGPIRVGQFVPFKWNTNPLVIEGFVDKATNKLITTGNSI